MGRELVERDDGTWWIVETVTDPKMRISQRLRANPRHHGAAIAAC